MPDLLFTNPTLAALYDALCPRAQRQDFDFYLPMIMSADSVLDVGCGTGSLLHEARDRGHRGRLCGLDPARGMLEQARKRSGIEWVEADLSDLNWENEFDFVVMTGHAFQVLLTDEEIVAALSAIRIALRKTGRFAFETRNPAAREWERWDTQYSGEVVDSAGSVVTAECRVEMPIRGELVTFSHTFINPAWGRPKVSRSTLRFTNPEKLRSLVAQGGMALDEQYGDWDRSELDSEGAEIITIARCP